MALTFQQMVDQVTRKVIQTDPESQAMCQLFVNQRQREIYDRFLWRDSKVVAPPVAGAAGVGTYPVPGTIERVITVRWGGLRLEYVSTEWILDVDPTLLDATNTGTPRYWTELQAAGGLSVQLMPAPTAAQQIYLVGKGPCQDLINPTDTPVVRSIGNALLALVEADMLERAQLYEVAGLARQRGNDLVKEAIDLEQQQSDLQRNLSPLTQNGDSLGEMIDGVCARVGAFDPTTRAFAREALQRYYRDLVDSALWRELTLQRSVPLVVLDPNDTQRQGLVIPSDIAQVQTVLDQYGRSLEPYERQFLQRTDGVRMNQPAAAVSAAPYGFVINTPLAYPAILNRVPLQFSISMPAEQTEVYVRGLAFVGGVDQEAEERVVVVGSAPVQTANTYSLVWALSRSDSRATISAGLVGGPPVVSLPPGQHAQSWSHLQLFPLGVAGTVFQVTGKRRVRPLRDDRDTPDLPGTAMHLICRAAADLALRLNKPAVAAKLDADAKIARASLVSLEREQQADHIQIIPWMDGPIGYPGEAGAGTWPDGTWATK